MQAMADRLSGMTWDDQPPAGLYGQGLNVWHSPVNRPRPPCRGCSNSISDVVKSDNTTNCGSATKKSQNRTLPCWVTQTLRRDVVLSFIFYRTLDLMQYVLVHFLIFSLKYLIRLNIY